MLDRLASPREGESGGDTIGWAVRDAVEVATTVKITDDVLSVFGRAWHAAPQDGPPGTRRRAALASALTALGFEVAE
jgi:hypothetical protein